MSSGETLFSAIRNRANILNLIRANESIYRAELAWLTGLTIPTVTVIVGELIEKGLVEDIGRGDVGIGKPPRLVRFVLDSYYIIGVDIGDTNLTALVMDLSAKVVYKQTAQADISGGVERITAQVESLVGEALAFLNAENRKCLGIGLGVSGDLDPFNGLTKFNLPVITNKATRCMALAEQLFGAAKGIDNFVCVNLGKSIDAAIVLDGNRYLDAHQNSGWLSHMILERNGPLCKCGNFGCLEALASGSAIAEKMTQYIADGRPTILAENTAKGAIDAKMVFDAAREGDDISSWIVREAIDYIGIALANVANYMDLAHIVLLGGMTKAGDMLLKDIKNSFALRKTWHTKVNCGIEFGRLGENAAAIGAAAFFLKKLLDSGGTWTPEAEAVK